MVSGSFGSLYGGVRDALTDEWEDLAVLAGRCGSELSGSGWETVADALVDEGFAEAERRPHAAMGKVYRRARAR